MRSKAQGEGLGSLAQQAVSVNCLLMLGERAQMGAVPVPRRERKGLCAWVGLEASCRRGPGLVGMKDRGSWVTGMGQPLERSEAEPFLPKLDDFKVAHCPGHAGPPIAEKHASEGGLVGP